MSARKLIVALAILVGVAAFTSTVVMVAYPGSFKWTAPVLCPDDQPDPYVVRYESRTSDGKTGINFTLFCMGPDGQFTEVGTWRPLAVLTGVVGAGLAVLVAGLATLAWLSRHHRPTVAPVDAPEDAPRDAPVDAPSP